MEPVHLASLACRNLVRCHYFRNHSNDFLESRNRLMSIALLASTENNFSVMDIEIGLTAIAFAAAFAWPGSGSSWFLRVECLFRRLAHRRGLAVLTVGLAALFLRVA